MMISKNVSLKPYNTFGLEVFAAQFVEVHSTSELNEIITNTDTKHIPKFILGGGSNILFTKDFDGLIIRNKIAGIEVVQEDDESRWRRSLACICIVDA